MAIFKGEYTQLYGNYRENKNTLKCVKKTQIQTLKMLISQELQLSGISSEFMINRVPKLLFGDNLVGLEAEEMDQMIMSKVFSDCSPGNDKNLATDANKQEKQ